MVAILCLTSISSNAFAPVEGYDDDVAIASAFTDLEHLHTISETEQRAQEIDALDRWNPEDDGWTLPTLDTEHAGVHYKVLEGSEKDKFTTLSAIKYEAKKYPKPKPTNIVELIEQKYSNGKPIEPGKLATTCGKAAGNTFIKKPGDVLLSFEAAQGVVGLAGQLMQGSAASVAGHFLPIVGDVLKVAGFGLSNLTYFNVLAVPAAAWLMYPTISSSTDFLVEGAGIHLNQLGRGLYTAGSSGIDAVKGMFQGDNTFDNNTPDAPQPPAPQWRALQEGDTWDGYNDDMLDGVADLFGEATEEGYDSSAPFMRGNQIILPEYTATHDPLYNGPPVLGDTIDQEALDDVFAEMDEAEAQQALNQELLNVNLSSDHAEMNTPYGGVQSFGASDESLDMEDM